jgi:hypothetical protein
MSRLLQRQFGQWNFMLLGTINPVRMPAGTVLESMPQARYAKASTTALNPHGAGPFCRFVVSDAPRQDGVYALTADDQVMYIGKAQDLAQRWGSSGYGTIQPKNCYVGGQSTNCKINAAVLRTTKAGQRLDLYFFATDNRRAIEAQLIADLHPPWNGR